MTLPSHVRVLSPAPAADFPHEWYALNSSEHFWFDWRFRAFRSMVRALRLDPHRESRALDVGCGTGILRDQIERDTAWTIDGIDVSLEPLLQSNAGRGTFYQYDIFDREHAGELPPYDYIFLFDVLEHIRDTSPFIAATLRHLEPDGFLFVNVPAIEALRSHYDTVAGHVRRYTVGSLTEEFTDFPLVPRYSAYWGFALLPLLALRKAVVRPGQDDARVIHTGFEPPARFVNGLLRAAAAVETSLLRRPILGTSVMMALQRAAP